MYTGLIEQTRSRLESLCLTHPDRHVGGAGNRAANQLFEREVAAAGFVVERLPFQCVDWEHGSASVTVGDQEVILNVGPYSPPFRGRARLVSAQTVEELEALDGSGVVLLLHGPIAAEQLTPRAYPFYQMDEHRRILAALDAVKPGAVIAATDRTPMAAALRPFPLFEDADAGFPSAYLLHTEVEQLLAHIGEDVDLEIDSRQVASTGEQLVARRVGSSSKRVLVSAHIDSRHGTPGALDNATGVVMLLALADLLKNERPALSVELLPFNGEDNFAAYGEVAYLNAYGDSLGDVELAINIDAAGRIGDLSAISFYSCPDGLRDTVMAVASGHASVVEGPSWPMSDHMVFAMRSVPAMAVTSTGLAAIAAEVAHTASDMPALADPELVVATAVFLRDVARCL